MTVDTRGAKRRRLLASQGIAEPSGGGSGSSSSHRVKSETIVACPSLRPAKDHVSLDTGKAVARFDTFHPFPRLPAELRLQIWRDVAQDATEPFHPLRVRVYRGTERVYRSTNRRLYYVRHVPRLATLPDLALVTRKRRSLLSISRECRQEMKKLWDSKVQLERGRVLRFSFKYDVVYLDIVNAAVIDDMLELRRKDDLPGFASAIGHVGFDMTPNVPLWMITNHEDLEPQLRMLLCFPRLHTMSLVAFSAFEPEINWLSTADANWVWSRTRGHRVYLRGFPALPGVTYDALKSTVGNRAPAPMHKHDCAICTIHKCVYVNEVLGASPARQARLLARSQLSPGDLQFLRNLKHHTLMATKPYVAGRFPAYHSGTLRWWKNLPVIQPPSSDDNSDDEEDDWEHNSDDDDDEGDDPMADGTMVGGMFVGGNQDDDSDDFDEDGHHFHHHGVDAEDASDAD
ncbi:hypothetical protein SPBR_08461 [Sporothrix brasiliensis 5110]|uniref:2EXR domain-containing protein n=1 Tax=Sporothrix brasiliensis 5110 TaxID=1398154 RepID=A0A0C2IHA7_9PEZI|nr:uncharacterized protein SPBR_08461 [Sporothrix brasiliensis 5110]KIH86410.1 hypothetical protein SPBR_08461 [Sporothrix brasiliensis 5110]